jgi:hypothetical protein
LFVVIPAGVCIDSSPNHGGQARLCGEYGFFRQNVNASLCPIHLIGKKKTGPPTSGGPANGSMVIRETEFPTIFWR